MTPEWDRVVAPVSGDVMKKIRTWASLGLLIVLAGCAAYLYWPLIDEWLTAYPPDATEAELQALSKSPTLARPPSVSSPLGRDEQALYTDLLAARPADVLVATVSTPRAEGLDHAARWLSAWRLAALIADRTGLRIAEPVITTRALGANRRAIDEAQVLGLARKIGARWAVTTEVDRRGRTMSVKLAVLELASNRRTEKVLERLEFDDPNPPENALLAALTDVPGMLGVPLRESGAGAAAAPAVPVLPPEAYRMVSEAPSTGAEAAMRLQLLAASMPPGSPQALLFYARSLTATDGVAKPGAQERLAKARALLHLGRRPAALPLLQDGGAAVNGLKAYADGDLTGLLAAIPTIQSPLARLLAALEAEELRSAYNNTEGSTERSAEIAKAYPDYPSLLAMRLTEHEWFSDEIVYEVALRLQKQGIQFAALSTEPQRGWIGVIQAWIDYYRFKGMQLFPLAAEIEAQRPALWRRNAASWNEYGFLRHPSPADYFEVLFQANRMAVYKHAAAPTRKQAIPARTLELVPMVETAFARDSSLNMIESEALYAVERKENKGNDNTRKRERAQRLARDAYLWEGGETAHARHAEDYVWKKTVLSYDDEPPQPVQRKMSRPRDRFEATAAVRAGDVEARLAEHLRRLPYNIFDARVMNEIERAFGEAGRRDDFDRLVAGMPNRFRGSGWSGQYAEKLARRATPETELALLRAQLDANPDDWRAYPRLARALLKQGKAADARDLYLGYPPFRGGGDNQVVTGNQAGQAAEQLLDFGDIEQAIPLLELCAAFRTGSGYSFYCREQIEWLRGNLKAAREWAGTNYRRYQGAGAARRFMFYAFLGGEDAQAWEVFGQAIAESSTTEYLDGAAYGSKLRGESPQQAFERIEAWNPKGSADYAGALRDHWVFQILFSDRAPSDEAMTLLRRSNQRHGDPSYLAIAAGYVAFQKRAWADLASQWGGLGANLSNASFRSGKSDCYPLPYLVLAHSGLGTDKQIGPLRAQYEARFPDSFEMTLVRAIDAANTGDHAQAARHLEEAFAIRPTTDGRPMHVNLMLLELVEAIYEIHPDERYRRFLADKAARMAHRTNQAYAHAFVALYGENVAVRAKAIEEARRLDRASMHLAAALTKNEKQARK